ncbi:MAG: trigger factor, partial [Eggerthellaceae bacterium]|nr:trigger factor [Eggerthellaceae bacterium]
YELGMGLFPKEFDEALIGLKKGESATVTIDPESPSMMTRSLGDDADKVTFHVEIKQVKKRILPDLTDEWVKEKAGFESVAELRERMADQIKAQKEQMMPQIRENEALYVLQERLAGEVPEGIREAQEAELLQNFFAQLQQSGMSFDMFLAQNGMTPETFKDDLKQQALDVAMQDLALDAWALHGNFEVTDEEISEEFAKSGAEDPAVLEAEWRESGRISPLRFAIKRTKAMKDILDGMEVTELPAGEKLRSVRERETKAEEAKKKAETEQQAADKKNDKKATKNDDAEEKKDNGESDTNDAE